MNIPADHYREHSYKLKLALTEAGAMTDEIERHIDNMDMDFSIVISTIIKYSKQEKV
ncbi:MAG: hypothetical protein SVK08_01265 [Halobacteriota archaeon]|nr:hypothetical protein [Halobacteriota archaeon]